MLLNSVEDPIRSRRVGPAEGPHDAPLKCCEVTVLCCRARIRRGVWRVERGSHAGEGRDLCPEAVRHQPDNASGLRPSAAFEQDLPHTVMEVKHDLVPVLVIRLVICSSQKPTDEQLNQVTLPGFWDEFLLNQSRHIEGNRRGSEERGQPCRCWGGGTAEVTYPLPRGWRHVHAVAIPRGDRGCARIGEEYLSVDGTTPASGDQARPPVEPAWIQFQNRNRDQALWQRLKIVPRVNNGRDPLMVGPHRCWQREPGMAHVQATPAPQLLR